MELLAPNGEGSMQVELKWDTTLRMWVPREMTESWRALDQKVTGHAEYDRFQRLVVSIDGDGR